MCTGCIYRVSQYRLNEMSVCSIDSRNMNVGQELSDDDDRVSQSVVGRRARLIPGWFLRDGGQLARQRLDGLIARRRHVTFAGLKVAAHLVLMSNINQYQNSK